MDVLSEVLKVVKLNPCRVFQSVTSKCLTVRQEAAGSSPVAPASFSTRLFGHRNSRTIV